MLNNNTQGAPNNHGTPPPKRNNAPGAGITPGSSRPATRRREPSDAAVGGNPFATATPPQITRRRTDLRDGDEGGSPIRDRAFFGRWGSTAGAGEDEKEKDEGSGSTVSRNTSLFRRGSSAATWGGSGSNSSLNSPMGTFGNSAFGGGPMGGFALQPGDKSKAATKGNSNSTQPKVEDVHERPEDDNPQKPPSDITYEDERERPMTSDTDPFGVGGAGDDHHSSHDDRNSPLPTPGIHDQQRHKSSPFGPGAGISITTPNNPRVGSSLGTPTKTRGDLAFQTFGGPREGLGGMGNLGMTGLHNQLQNLTFNQQGQVPLRRSREGSIGNALAGENEPLSPAETNPFQSPPPEKVDDDGMMNDQNESGGLGSVIAGLRRGENQPIGAPGSDRSGRSSTAGLGSVGGGLGGFGGLTGPGLWSSGQSVGTPGVVSSGTPSSFFSGGGLGDLTSPGGSLGGGSLLSGGLGGVSGLGGSGHFGSASRASRLGQLFPESQQHQDDGQAGFESGDAFGGDSRFSAFGSRRGFGSITDSPMRERGDVADLFGFPSARSLSNLAGAAAAQDNPMFTRDREDALAGLQQPSHQTQQESTLGANVQNPGQPLRPPPGTLPPQQQHVMVMPDKIQWVYRDPSGVVQGPFNGLEMHEWYRAGFFTPDLAVKRQEDTEFEQLGNLVRKIGNTREPFLVPLPGNSSAGMSTNAAANWPGSWLNEMPGAQQQAAQTPGSVQPPFAGSFPTFGTTLTAEQQNALERRKQEEQYLMAKQREFLLQQQMMAKQAAVAQQLHHQSSTQSLHSQPSFGSLHSPASFVPAPASTTATAATIIGGQNAFEPGALLRQAGAAAGGVGGLDVGGQLGFQQQFQPQVSQAQQPQDQGLLMKQNFVEQQRQQLQKSYQNQQNQHAEKQALQDAQEQAQQVAVQLRQLQQFDNQTTEDPSSEQPATQEKPTPEPQNQESEPAAPKARTPSHELVVNIPKLPSQKLSPAPKPTQPAWGGHQAQPAPLVQPFPPPPARETSPTSSMARSPSAETPSAPTIAPWAKEVDNQTIKTPSLKEIQEIEAKQAAAREAAEAQARREILSQQITHQPPPPPAPGLPSTATWATSPSTTPSTGISAWNKPLAKATPVAAGRKTLQQIQKEEEARKAKAAAAAASQAAMSSSNPIISAAGKRYADLASKAATATQNPMTNSAWTTVGPGGKSKGGPLTPTAPSAVPTAPAQTLRTSTSSVGFGAAAAKRPTPPVAPSKPATTSAQEEFLKWCRASMKGLNSGVSRKLLHTLTPIRTKLTSLL